MAGSPSIDISFPENEMKHYTEDFLCELKNDIISSFSFGSPIIIKPIPFVKKGGVLDPLEKEIALKTIAERVNTPITVEAIRHQTGFPSLNLNEVQILDDVLSFHLDSGIFASGNTCGASRRISVTAKPLFTFMAVAILLLVLLFTKTHLSF
ncbi:MAG: hypothetical protein WC366_05460 [Bacilli bacterium]|jgi:hypothetical protein